MRMAQAMNGDRLKIFAAKWHYRWNMSQSILGAVFSAATFVGVFTLLLGPVMRDFGITYSQTLFLLLAFVLVVFFGLGTVLDRVVKFWAAQAIVGTIRNPFLIDRLYQKEALTIATEKIPELKAMRSLMTNPKLIDELDDAIARLEAVVRNKKWNIRPGEEVYEDSR